MSEGYRPPMALRTTNFIPEGFDQAAERLGYGGFDACYFSEELYERICHEITEADVVKADWLKAKSTARKILWPY